MSRNLKTTLGLGLLAALIASGAGVMSATATTSGHFISSSGNGTEFRITESTGTAHETALFAWGLTVFCHQATYKAHHVNTQTFTLLTVTPEYKSCTHNDGSPVTVRMNECHYAFKSRASGTGHATVHLFCPPGKKAEVQSASGLQKYGSQTPTQGGVTYTNLADGTVTANITVEGIHGECHGFCEIIGTNTTSARLIGSVTVEGLDTVAGSKVNLSAT